MIAIGNTKFTKTDALNNFSEAITKRMKFCALDQWRMRTEAYILIMTLGRMFTEDRIIDDSSTIEPGNKGHISSTASRNRTETPAVSIPPLLNCAFLTSTIDPDDVIEYRLNSSLGTDDEDTCIRRATVTGIRLELDGMTKTVLLNNGDTLTNSLHMVRRISMRNLYSGEVMWNRIWEWVALSSVHKHVTVDAADGPDNTLRIRDHQGGNTTNLDGDGRVEDPEMVNPSKIQGDYARDRQRRDTANKKIR